MSLLVSQTSLDRRSAAEASDISVHHTLLNDQRNDQLGEVGPLTCQLTAAAPGQGVGEGMSEARNHRGDNYSSVGRREQFADGVSAAVRFRGIKKSPPASPAIQEAAGLFPDSLSAQDFHVCLSLPAPSSDCTSRGRR